MTSAKVIQGYFPQGTPKHLAQGQSRAIQPRVAKSGGHHSPTYQELTIEAHRRSASQTAQHSSVNGDAFMLPQHLASFSSRPGQSLLPAVQRQMASFFNADFSDVRVHVGPEASLLGASAFTQGSNIFFAPGQYNPSLPHGQQLLAHELTHVLQQRAGRVRNPFGSGVAVLQDPALEAEANRMSQKAVMYQISAIANQRTVGVTASFPSIQRNAILQRAPKSVLQKAESGDFPPPEHRQSLATDTSTLHDTLVELERVISDMPNTSKNSINLGKAPIHFTCSIERKSVGNVMGRCGMLANHLGSEVTQGLAWYDPEGSQKDLNNFGPHITIRTAGKQTGAGKIPDVYHHIFFKYGETKEVK